MSDELTPASERDVVQRLRDGDLRAFEQVYDAFYERLWRFTYGYVGSRAVAQEIVHDVFLALWTNRAAFDVHSTLDGYLYGAVRNRARNVARHERVEQRRHDMLARERADDGAADPTPSAQEQLERAEATSRVARAVAALSERHRTAILLRWKHGMRYEAIARVLGVSPQAARTLVLRVQETLKGLIGPPSDP